MYVEVTSWWLSVRGGSVPTYYTLDEVKYLGTCVLVLKYIKI